MSDCAVTDDEANAFAMELLMPFDLIVKDAANIDLCDDDAIAKLAKRYRVPTASMAVRIGEVRMELALSGSAHDAQPLGNSGTN